MNKTEGRLIGRKLHEKLNIKEKFAVSIFGNVIKKEIYDKNHKKYEFFLNNLLKYVRSSDSCIISGDCREFNDDIINLSQLIGQKLQDNPYYDSKENNKVKLIGVRSIHDLIKDIKQLNESTDDNNRLMTEEQAEEALFSNKRDERNKLPSDKMEILRYHTDFVFANTEEDAQSLRLKFEMQFDFVTYILINLNLKEQLEYLDKVILSGKYNRLRIIYVTVSL